jgi:hypothetical protein
MQELLLRADFCSAIVKEKKRDFSIKTKLKTIKKI